MKKFLIVLTATALVSTTALAKVAQVSISRTTGGNAVEFPNKHMPSGYGVNRLKPFNEELQTRHDLKSADRAQKMMERNNSALTGLLINKGRIVFEGYRGPATPKSKMHSMSMSKSLTALVIGNLYCDGKIDSLDDTAGKYANWLDPDTYGNTTIRNFLMMASGMKKYGKHGWPKPHPLREVKFGRRDVLWFIQGHTREYEQGTRHNYNSGDTMALQQVARSFGGLVENFNHYIWSRIGTEVEGSWMVSRTGEAVSWAGFNASVRDWGRLGMYTIDMAKGRGGSCMQEYVQDMLSQQINNRRARGQAGRAFAGYGYQTWVMQNGNAWWAGYGGQRVGINVELEKVMVIHSHKENYMREAYDVFNYFADWD